MPTAFGKFCKLQNCKPINCKPDLGEFSNASKHQSLQYRKKVTPRNKIWKVNKANEKAFLVPEHPTLLLQTCIEQSSRIQEDDGMPSVKTFLTESIYSNTSSMSF